MEYAYGSLGSGSDFRPISRFSFSISLRQYEEERDPFFIICLSSMVDSLLRSRCSCDSN